MPGFALALVATLSFGVLAFGAVYPWAYWTVAVLSAELGLWAIVLGRSWHDWRVWRLGKVLGVVAIAIALQIVPMPPAVLSFVSPNLHDVQSQYELAYASRERGWLPVSLAPWDTALALALFSAFGLLLVGTTRALRYVDLPVLVQRLTFLALFVAIVGIVQKVAAPDSELIYGFWRPIYKGEGFGPFVNRNHYAGWVVMVLPLVAASAIGMLEATARGGGPGRWRGWLSSPKAGQAAFAIAVVVVLGISIVLSRSRSGLLCVAVGLGVLSAFVSRRRGRRPRALGGLILVVALVVAAAVAWAGYDIVVDRMERLPVEIQDRVSVWTDTVRLIAAFPIAGVGFGAFSRAMAVYQTTPTHTLFAQAHNDYLQVMAEGGLLVGLPALIAVALIAQGIWRRFQTAEDEPLRFWIRAGAVAGLSAIAAQALVDFSLQKPGNTALFVVLLAIALHRPSRTDVPDAHRV